MKFFKRENRVLDLTKRYKKQQARAEEMKPPQAYPETFPTEMSTEGKDMQESDSSSAGGLGFFGAIGNTVSQNATGTASENEDSYVDISSGVDDKRRKLAKRLMEMTNKIEELSNQIYHLQQRIEVLEKKGGVAGY